MPKPFLYIANWKMRKTFDQTKSFIADFGSDLAALAAKPGIEIVIAPSFVCLHYSFAQLDPAIGIAAQDCSTHSSGAYTGQVDAISLKQVGCRYGLVGHSEARSYGYQSDALVADKMEQLLQAGITPIVCIGETEADYKSNQTHAVLARQLAPLAKILAAQKNPVDIVIAYEPIWSIGTGLIADLVYLNDVFDFLTTWATHQNLKRTRIVYGGSVDESNAAVFKTIRHCDGFLIGSASLDFQKFQNIVSLF